MQRIRFLTAIAVGASVTENLEDNPEVRDASPYLVWEWLVVEALMRSKGEDPGIWGIPGTLVARRALNQYGYLLNGSFVLELSENRCAIVPLPTKEAIATSKSHHYT